MKKKISEEDIEKAQIRSNYVPSKYDKLIAIDHDTPFIALMQDAKGELYWTVDFKLEEHFSQSNKIPRIKVSEYLHVWRCV